MQTNPILQPHPKQIEFLSSDVRELFYGGSRGGGKSWILAYDAALHYRSKDRAGNVKVSIDYPDYTALLIRRKFVDIETNFKPICDSIYKLAGGRWKARERCYVFPSGAKIILAHLDTESDVDKYIGGNYSYLGIEEANQFPWEWLEKLYPSVRSTNKAITPFIRLTSNPGGIGHLWLKKRFFDVCMPKEAGKQYSQEFDVEYPIYKSGKIYKDDENNTRKFIPALVFDNPSLIENDPQYVRGLKAIRDPVLRAMWLLGSWDTQTGAFFDEWNPMFHIMSDRDFKLDKENCRIYRAIDYGSTNPFVCLFVQRYPDGRIVIFDEIYAAGIVPSNQAQMILDKSRRWKLKESDFDLTICDPSMRQKTHQYLNDFEGVFQIYLREGMENIHFGDNERVPGWQILREYLHVPDYDEENEEDGYPLLRICARCEHTIESFTTAVRSTKNVEDVDTRCDDHPIDAIRYLVKFIDKPFRKVKEVIRGWKKRLQDKAKNRHKLKGDMLWCQ